MLRSLVWLALTLPVSDAVASEPPPPPGKIQATVTDCPATVIVDVGADLPATVYRDGARCRFAAVPVHTLGNLGAWKLHAEELRAAYAADTGTLELQIAVLTDERDALSQQVRDAAAHDAAWHRQPGVRLAAGFVLGAAAVVGGAYAIQLVDQH